MFAKSKFLQTIVQHINHDTAAQPELITCLKVITNQLGLTIHPAAFDKLELHAFMQANHFSGPLGMLITSINQPCPSQLAKTYFPLLIQDQYGNYLVYLKKKCGKYLVFDAALNREISLNARELAAKLVQVWQCSPICPELITGIKKLVKYFTKTFTSQVITILFASLIFSLLNSSMTAAASYFIANIGLMNQSWLAANYLPIPLFFLVMGMLVYSNGILQNSLTTRIITRVLPAIWQQLLSQTLSVLRQFTTGDMTQRLADYELALTSAIPILLSMIFSIFTLLLLFLFMAYLNTSLTWCYLIIACFFLAIKLFLIPLNVKHMQAECKMQGKVTGYLNEVFLQIHKIRASHAEASIYNKWLSFWVELKAQSEQLMMFKKVFLLLEIAMPLSLLLVFYSLIYIAPRQQYGLWLQFMVCASQFTAVFDKFSNQLLVLLHHIPGMRRIETMLPPVSPPIANKLNLLNVNGDISFSQVSYNDSTSGRVILNDINFSINQGEFIGIIGESGAGKSTLFKLLLGLENLTSGRISLDDINIEHVDGQVLRKQFGVVLQNSNVFPGSILANLGINKSLTQEEAWQLAEAVGLDQDIQLMPMKMHTYISDNAGESISGGQKQKILLARALATKPRILLLDEATSALDAISQATIYRYLQSLNITRIVIAHRPNTLLGADKIYLLQNGRLSLVS